MNYSLSGQRGRSFQEFPEYNQPNKFSKTLNDAFGIGKDLFGSYQGLEGAGGSWMPFLGGAINSGKTALSGGSWRDDIPQAFFGIDNKNDSDVMQTLKGAGKGAMMGTMVFPGVGTAIGALLGAGASFLDDI